MCLAGWKFFYLDWHLQLWRCHNWDRPLCDIRDFDGTQRVRDCTGCMIDCYRDDSVMQHVGVAVSDGMRAAVRGDIREAWSHWVDRRNLVSTRAAIGHGLVACPVAVPACALSASSSPGSTVKIVSLPAIGSGRDRWSRTGYGAAIFGTPPAGPGLPRVGRHLVRGAVASGTALRQTRPGPPALAAPMPGRADDRLNLPPRPPRSGREDAGKWISSATDRGLQARLQMRASRNTFE
jgi:hypothetical protein